MMILLIVLGAVSLMCQVILLRELTVAFFGSELVILLGVGLWLLGTGLGAAAGRIGGRPRDIGVAAGLPALALALPLLIGLARGSRILWGGIPGAYLAFPTQMAAMALVMLPAALLTGLMFAHAAALAVRRGRSLATAYAVECAGGLIGGAAATLLLAAGVGNLSQAFGCSTVAATAAAVAAGTGRPQPTRPAFWVYGAVVIVTAAGLAAAPALDRLATAWNHPDLIAGSDTPYGRVTVEARAEQLAIFLDDALAYENEGTAAEEFVQLASLQCAHPGRVLVLGGGPAGLLTQARRLAAEEVVYVEMDRRLLDLMRRLPADLGLGPDGPGPAPQVVVADPRDYLENAGSFDLILVGAPPPATGRDNRFYTREFFAACNRSLAPGGVLAFRLPGAENVWTPARLRQLAGIRRALEDVFTQVVVIPGTLTVITASSDPLPRTAAAPAARLRERGAANRLVTPAYLEYIYGNDRFNDLEGRLAALDTPANTDSHPACYRQTLLLWTSRFFPSLGWRDLEPPAAPDLIRSVRLWPALLAAAAVVMVLRRRDHCRRNLAMAFAGAAGMMIEAALILDYQVRVGALYQDLGILLCLFMLGMALGAAAHAGLPRPRSRRAFLALLPATALAAAWLMGRGHLGSLPAAGAALATCAGAVGLVFACLSRSDPARQAELASPLLAADLIGSSLGCLAASLLLIPAWGQAGAAAAAAVLGMIVLML
jgi:spermidine synthase